MNSMMFLGQLLGGAVRVWLDVALVAGIMLAIIFRPERIRSLSLFQFGCGLWALSNIAPNLVVFLVESPVQTRSPMGMGMGTGSGPDLGVMTKVVMLTGPILFALAFLCIVFALLPSGKAKSSGPAV